MNRFFKKGGKLERFHPVYDMLYTMLVVKPDRTTSGAHVRDHFDIKRMMTTVILATIPAFCFGIYNAGYQHYISMGQEPLFWDCVLKGAYLVVPVLVVAYATGGFCEMIFAVIRQHEINEGFLVSGFFIPLILPPGIPLWQVAVASAFGVVIGKEVFGGTGMNIFNPALVARAFIFFAYPSSISGERVWTSFGDTIVDTYTMATPLSTAVSNTGTPVVAALEKAGYSFYNMFLGFIPGSVGETSTLAILLGAALLILTGVGSWRIMMSVVAGGLIMGFVMNAAAPSPESMLALPPWYHLVMGGFAFGAVFMATDPVTAAATNAGKYVYGLLIGMLAVLIRCLNPAYPEGMMLSILFMNAFAPLIDNVVVWRNIERRHKRAAR